MGITGAYRLGPESGRLLVHTTRTGLGPRPATISPSRSPAGRVAPPSTRHPGQLRGIRPSSAFFGALKLSDEVKLDFEVALTRHG